jgi:hypothetical protein
MMKGISPSSIYMRGKGGQQYICGPNPLQATYKATSRLTHVECYTPRVHMSISKVMSSTSKAPMQGCSMRCVQHSYKPPMTPMNLLSHVLHWVHSPCMNTMQPRHPQVNSRPPCKHPSYPMLSRAQHPPHDAKCSSNARHSPSKQPPPCGQHVECHQVV